MAMKLFVSFLLYSTLFILSNLGESAKIVPSDEGRTYIVYMGDAASPTNKNNHNFLMSSLLKRNKNAVIQSYKHAISGFAAKLSDSEVAQLAKHPGVVSVFPEPILQLHTTRSWDFLKDETSLLIDSVPRSTNAALETQGSDTIIGVLDTGIWPEAESFNDKDMGPIPSRWKGTCLEGQGFNSSNCNKKLIGARYYKDTSSVDTMYTARDSEGHGTHVASTAAGVSVLNASYYGLASGTAKGGSPTSRIAMYRVCDSNGCTGSAILSAFDDAIGDGVDVISLSLGASGHFAPDFTEDPIAIGSFHAVQRGITVVCSAGNDGPDVQSVVNVAPWILTVAATTIDRDLESDVVLGNNKVVKGGAINFSNLEKSPQYPLIYGGSAKARTGDDYGARNCYPESLDATKIKGTIVLCQHESLTYTMKQKRNEVKSLGGVGVIFISDQMRNIAPNSISFPGTVITAKDAAEILEYINSTSNAVATILPTVTVADFKPAPKVAYFSSRGPSYTTKNILKPDISAPGVNILAAWKGNDTSAETTPSGKEPPQFNLLSGTSMSCPHVSAIVAVVKSQNPTWSPAAIRSAVMTTAMQTNNLKEPITSDTGTVATPYDYGAGQVSPTGGVQPGLVYELDPAEYLQFLCFYGYNLSAIKLMAGELPQGFSCPKEVSKDMISNINYPSIAISNNIATTTVTVNRTVTNVDAVEDTTYAVTVDAPKGVEVDVTPKELRFTPDIKTLSYQVTFSSSSPVKSDMFGAIIWTNRQHKVRSPFAISSA